MNNIMKLADAYANETFFIGNGTGSPQTIKKHRAALEAAVTALEKDAERYRWLRERYTAVNFDWEESDQQAVIFTTDNFPVATVSCDETIDAAMEAK